MTKEYQVNFVLDERQYMALAKAAYEYGGFATGSFARAVFESATENFTTFEVRQRFTGPIRRASKVAMRNAMWNGGTPAGGTEKYAMSITPQIDGGTYVGIPGVHSLTPEQAEAERKQVFAAWGLNPDGSDIEGFGKDEDEEAEAE